LVVLIWLSRRGHFPDTLGIRRMRLTYDEEEGESQKNLLSSKKDTGVNDGMHDEKCNDSEQFRTPEKASAGVGPDTQPNNKDDSSLIAATDPGISAEQYVRYDYCVVLRTSEHKTISKLASKLITSFEQVGLQTYVYIPSTSERQLVYILVRPREMDVLRKFAEKINYRMKLDPVRLKHYLLEQKNVDINDDPYAYKYGPTEYMFAPYQQSLEHLFWTKTEYNDDHMLVQNENEHPFSCSERLRLIELMMLGGVQREQSMYELNICRLYRMGHICAYFPLPEHLTKRELSGNIMSCREILMLQTLPHAEIVEYFGSKTNVYFAFAHHLANWLLAPALIGVVFQIVVWNYKDLSYPVTPFFALIMSWWSLLVMKAWKRKQTDLQLFANTEQYEETEANRPEFKGARMKSFVDGSEFRYFARRKFLFRVTVGAVITCLCCIASLACVAGIYYLQFRLQSTSLAAAAQSICSAINVFVVSLLLEIRAIVMRIGLIEFWYAHCRSAY
jgi:hypothetical protein